MRMCYWKRWRQTRMMVRYLLALVVDKRAAILTVVRGKRYWHLSRAIATQTGKTNDWPRTQGLGSIRDLWMRARGYA